MPINTDLLIAAPMLQDLLVDKNGLPMAAGTITCYHDNSRTTLKNWYYQSGTPGNYTWIPLPNPLTLSAAGTICDINGVDTIPFWYPYDELDETQRDAYYITILSYDETTEITRANFPYNAIATNTEGAFNFQNYIINNVFWRNLGSADLTAVTDEVIAPSQHDGFLYHDVRFMKNIIGGADTLTFIKFLPSTTPPLTGDITPEVYLNHECTNRQTGETQKYYQFPVSFHLSSITSTQYTVTIQAQNNGTVSPGSNIINLALFQDTGSGTTPPAPIPIGSCVLDSTWTKYSFTSEFPNNVGLTLGAAGDDAYYLQIQIPAGVPCNINFTKPSLFLTDTAPTNDFSTYDQIDDVISSPRTGDLRISTNSFIIFGWLPMNDGTIGNATSMATTRANIETWPLFRLLWEISAPFDMGGMSPFNPICQMYNSSGAPVNFQSTPIADFNANNQLALSKMLGRVMMGTAPASSLLSSTYFQTVTASNSAGSILFTPQSVSLMFQGMPVSFSTASGSLPTNIVPNAIYYITNIITSSGTFQVTTTYANAITGSSLVAWGGSAGSNVTLTLANTGTYLGEYAHTQAQAEVGPHTHPATTSANFQVSSTANSTATYLAAGNTVNTFLAEATSRFTTTVLNNQTGSPAQQAFNIVQEATFYNIFIKL